VVRNASVPPPPKLKKLNMPNINNKDKKCLEQLSFYSEYSKATRKIVLNGLTASLWENSLAVSSLEKFSLPPLYL
jgi:hypothetical protein